MNKLWALALILVCVVRVCAMDDEECGRGTRLGAFSERDGDRPRPSRATDSRVWAREATASSASRAASSDVLQEEQSDFSAEETLEQEEQYGEQRQHGRERDCGEAEELNELLQDPRASRLLASGLSQNEVRDRLMYIKKCEEQVNEFWEEQMNEFKEQYQQHSCAATASASAGDLHSVQTQQQEQQQEQCYEHHQSYEDYLQQQQIQRDQFLKTRVIPAVAIAAAVGVAMKYRAALKRMAIKAKDRVQAWWHKSDRKMEGSAAKTGQVGVIAQ